ncbi:MAG: hypothetical protein Q7U28_14895 [Aquabacterium sp.]|nr:hypothetical protein [Aquabacterium sp.]
MTGLPLSPQVHARVWIALALMLTSGAWLAAGLFDRPPPESSVPVAEVHSTQPVLSMMPIPGQVSGSPHAQGMQPNAMQVLEAVAHRGRQVAPASGAVQSAESLQTRVRQDPASVHRQSTGQRLRLQGTLALVEKGESGVVVLHLSLPDQSDSVQLVASPALAQTAAGWEPPRNVTLDCLSQGVMMGAWLLVDCRH